MKRNILITLLVVVMSGCYVYRPYQEPTEDPNAVTGQAKSLRGASRMGAADDTAEVMEKQKMSEESQAEQRLEQDISVVNPGNNMLTSEPTKGNLTKEDVERMKKEQQKKNQQNQSTSTEEEKPAKTTKQIIEPNKYYKITVFENDYKIEAEKWEGDTLIAHKKGKPKKQYKFAEKDIMDIHSRKFSKSGSDIITAASYAGAGAILLFILL